MTAVLVLITSACGSPPSESAHRFTRFSMGTVVDYTVVTPDEDSAREAVGRAHDEMERVSSLLWEDDSSSVVFGFNEAAERLAAPPEVADFLSRARRLAAETGGAFDPTIKTVLDLYGFGTDSHEPPDRSSIDALLPFVGYQLFDVTEPGYIVKDAPQVTLSVGGFAKGYAVDRAVGVLRKAGIRDAVVNAGGDLYCLGSRMGEPWRVGIRDPDDASGIAAVLEIRDAAVATSGDYQQYYDYDGTRYHHILVPDEGAPARFVRSATVVTTNAERADGLATALFVLGKTEGLALLESIDDAEGLVIDMDGAIHQTAGMSRFLNADAASRR